MDDTKLHRIAVVVTAGLFGYFIVEEIMRSAEQKRAAFAKWRADYVAPFIKHPRRLEWLRETLRAEEMHVASRPVTGATSRDGSAGTDATKDCGCDDA